MPKLLIGREYADDLISSVQNSKQSIKILMYDWRWYKDQPGARIQKFNQEILTAKKRGVDVRVILNQGHIKRILESYKIKVFVTNAGRTMHIKLILIDNKILFIGSHNLSINAFEINLEMSLKIFDQSVIDRCNHFFSNLCLL